MLTYYRTPWMMDLRRRNIMNGIISPSFHRLSQSACFSVLFCFLFLMTARKNWKIRGTINRVCYVSFFEYMIYFDHTRDEDKRCFVYILY